MQLVDRLMAIGCLGKNKYGVFVNVFVQPRASKNTLCGVHADSLKLRITAPPVDGKANAMVVKFFSKLFKLPKSSVQVVSGVQCRNKRILITGLDVDSVAAKMLDACSGLADLC